jgi:hypothetical protein
VNVHLVVITGFADGARQVQKEIDEAALTWHLNVCDPLDQSDCALSDESRIFQNPEDCERARRLVTECGQRAVAKNPLGFGDCEAVVVFDATCPNNSLPILWGGDREKWTPLFPRS